MTVAAKHKRRSYGGDGTRRTEADHSAHVRALRRRIEELEGLTPDGLRRVIAHFPELRKLFGSLAWLAMAADPTSAKVIDPEAPYVSGDSGDADGIVAVGDHKVTPRYAVSTGRYMETMKWANREIRIFSDRIDRAMGGEGESEAERAEAPRCRKKDPRTNENCVLYGRRQAFGQTHCRHCRQPFSEADRAQEAS